MLRGANTVYRLFVAHETPGAVIIPARDICAYLRLAKRSFVTYLDKQSNDFSTEEQNFIRLDVFNS